jgi:hypothetical protein
MSTYRYHGWAALALNEEILDYANDFETVDSWKHDRFQGEMYYICDYVQSRMHLQR